MPNNQRKKLPKKGIKETKPYASRIPDENWEAHRPRVIQLRQNMRAKEALAEVKQLKGLERATRAQLRYRYENTWGYKPVRSQANGNPSEDDEEDEGEHDDSDDDDEESERDTEEEIEHDAEYPEADVYPPAWQNNGVTSSHVLSGYVQNSLFSNMHSQDLHLNSTPRSTPSIDSNVIDPLLSANGQQYSRSPPSYDTTTEQQSNGLASHSLTMPTSRLAWPQGAQTAQASSVAIQYLSPQFPPLYVRNTDAESSNSPNSGSSIASSGQNEHTTYSPNIDGYTDHFRRH